ncbi:uncharacterized protein Eint_040655 [Encephalitozoon intestinalis ATCC 50506]|uniref:Uncharacterized protein n=1 Tax=Encephalitozoon intestinalis (strain ATCC 50506) TaxID=876142 RepID=W8PKF0_ENCIT|nr:uncharacterized protein Eint_040655 [Encephalitozoon intestinalis ATCC 50506]AHL30090.1 hypothetical protein Eint_040655 [Encephalitozoon intestinalis ATCC 50506]UTX45045.1 hypothetical protein GPK93_04g05820 [Encephalitozoon intestinalis]
MKNWILLALRACRAISPEPGTAVNNVLENWSLDFDEYVEKNIQAGRNKEGIVRYSSKCSGNDCNSEKTGCADNLCKSKPGKFSYRYDLLT